MAPIRLAVLRSQHLKRHRGRGVCVNDQIENVHPQHWLPRSSPSRPDIGGHTECGGTRSVRRSTCVVGVLGGDGRAVWNFWRAARRTLPAHGVESCHCPDLAALRGVAYRPATAMQPRLAHWRSDAPGHGAAGRLKMQGHLGSYHAQRRITGPVHYVGAGGMRI
jgi:hypothetical protein